jgi:bacillithiol system protein YtxJ
MFGLFKNEEKSANRWKTLDQQDQLEQLEKESFNAPVVLFKHSTRCSISHMAKSRLESSDSGKEPEIYYLDLIRYRDISNEIADRYNVRHESPQVIVLKDGKAIYHASHGSISMDELIQYAG